MESEASSRTARRIWAVAAIVISVLVLLTAAAGIAGTWISRQKAIEANDSLMGVVDRLAGTGRQGADRLGEGVGEINNLVAEMETAVDKVADNVSDKGVIMTLLPPEKEEKIVAKAEEIGDTLDSLVSAVKSAMDLYKTVDAIPFVDLPQPSETEVQTLEENVQEIQDSVEQLAGDIQDFREGTAAKVSKISQAAGDISSRLEKTSQNLSELDGKLADLQTQAEEWKARFRIYTAASAVVVSLMLAWIIYAMVVLIMKYWGELQA